MKHLLFATTLVLAEISLAAIIDGVPMNCSEKAEKRGIVNSRVSLVTACRSRDNSNVEYYTFGDGSGLHGFTMDSSKKCRATDFWAGQDDQDSIDPIDFKAQCLVAEDFSL